MEHDVSLTESAKGDIAHFRVCDQRIVVAGVMAHLKLLAEVQNAEEKNGSARIPSRLGNCGSAIFGSSTRLRRPNKVKVLAVGSKKGNELFIRGNQVEL